MVFNTVLDIAIRLNITVVNAYSDYPPPGRSYAGDFPTGRSGYYSRPARSEFLPPARSIG